MLLMYFELLKNFLLFSDEYKKIFKQESLSLLNINSDIVIQELLEVLKTNLLVLEDCKKYKIIKLISILTKLQKDTSLKKFYKGEVTRYEIRCEERKLMPVKCVHSDIKVFIPSSDSFNDVEIKIHFLF